jgi:SpoU rRNA methylase family enzyme
LSISILSKSVLVYVKIIDEVNICHADSIFLIVAGHHARVFVDNPETLEGESLILALSVLDRELDCLSYAIAPAYFFNHVFCYHLPLFNAALPEKDSAL